MSARAPGPGAFFIRHPALFGVSVACAFAVSGYSFARASKASGPQRIGLALLALLTAGEGVGTVVARHRARP